MDAGLAYNTWPLMDGTLVPPNLFVIDPWWLNPFENAKTVQFTHRVFGYVLWFCVLVHMITGFSQAPGSTHARRAFVLFVLVSLQAGIGIVTLLLQVPAFWALLHQGTALLVLAFAVAHWRAFRGSYRAIGDAMATATG